MQIRNPRTGVYDYTLEVTRPDQVGESALRLRSSQANWLAKGIDGRIEQILQLRSVMQDAADQLSEALAVDTGRRKISEIEVEGTLSMMMGRCHSVRQFYSGPDIRPSVTHPTVKIKEIRTPYALVGVISPWNFPLLLALIDAVPALLAGSTVLLKPSEVTPRFMDVLEECIQQVSSMSEVLALVRGGPDVGKSVVEHADVICFTGSVETGRKIALRCAERFIPAFLELGGKDPAIVLSDADLDMTTDAIIRSAVGATGQACQSLERIYVHHQIYADFLELLLQKVSQLRDNSDYAAGGVIGPLIYKSQGDKIVSQLQDAVAKGAKVLTGGTVKNLAGGLWLMPTVLVDVSHRMDVMTEETFGPVIPVMKFESEEEAIALANDSKYGLSASVFGQNVQRATHVASRIEAGGISINDASLTNQVFDAGKNSFNQSGLYGSRMGDEGFLRFFRKKALLIQEGKAKDIYSQSEESESITS